MSTAGSKVAEPFAVKVIRQKPPIAPLGSKSVLAVIVATSGNGAFVLWPLQQVPKVIELHQHQPFPQNRRYDLSETEEFAEKTQHWLNHFRWEQHSQKFRC